MIAWLVDWSLRNRFSVFGMVAALVAFGIHGYANLTVDAVPDVTGVQVQVLTSAPGLSPLEVESLVTRPVELSLTGIPGVTVTRSVSRPAISAVTLVFAESVDLNKARSLVAERLPAAREAVGDNAERPQLGPLSTSLGEVYHFTVDWPGHSSIEVRNLFDWEIAPVLRTVGGVVEVNAWGGDVQQIEVLLRPQDLRALDVTAEQVEQALLQGGHSVGGGALERGEEQYLVRLDARYRSIESIEQQVVRSDRGAALRVKDVATVSIKAAPRISAATADGKGPTQYAMVQMIAGGNAADVVARVKQQLESVRARLPVGVQIEPFYDRAAFVSRVLGTVWKSLFEGGAIVTLVLLLLLGSFRAGLVVATVIPLSMLGAFGFMHWLGLSGNLMSLGAIDFGLVVDGAVVMVEGALAAMAARQLSGSEALREDAQRFGGKIAFGVLIIGIVYLPITLLQGVEGMLFRPMALSVLLTLATALVLTFTWVPALASLVLSSVVLREPKLVSWLRSLYAKLNHRFTAGLGFPLLLGGSLLLAGGFIATRLGVDFVPRLEEGELVVLVARPPSVSLREAEAGTTLVEATLHRFPEVQRVVSRTGSPDVATDVMGLEQSDVFVTLRPVAEWTTAHTREELVAHFEQALTQALPGAAFGFTQPIELRVQELIGGVKSDVGIKIFGEDLGELRNIAAAAARAAASVAGAEDVRVEPSEGLPTVSLRPNFLELGRLGLNSSVLELSTQLLREGRRVGTYFVQGARQYAVQLRLGGDIGVDVEQLKQVPLPLGRQWVYLGDVSHVAAEDLPAQLSREQGRRRLSLELNVRGRDLLTFVTELKQQLKSIPLPTGYYFDVTGQYDNLLRASQRLLLVVPLTVLAVFLLLAMAFGEARSALLILLILPAALSGGVMALAARGMTFSVSGAIGLIALLGVATMNGVVLISAIKECRAQGATALLAARQGAQARLRPVITTAVVAALGFLPMALATGSGAEVQRPLATVVIGGLISATLVTLLVLPGLGARWFTSKSSVPD